LSACSASARSFSRLSPRRQCSSTIERSDPSAAWSASGFPFWEGSTWEWELGEASRAEKGTSVLFRHYGFGAGYAEIDLGHTAQTWALILDRLVRYVATGTPQPYFPASA
jgi:hypothetical protein